MKNISLFTLLFSVLLAFSCKKEETKTCADYDLDFLYSISYPVDSSYASVEFTNTSNNIPTNSTYFFTVNGDAKEYKTEYSTRFTENGHFSIVMKYYADGFICTVSKEFDITGVQ